LCRGQAFPAFSWRLPERQKHRLRPESLTKWRLSL
jgi:hypothetical protein